MKYLKYNILSILFCEHAIKIDIKKKIDISQNKPLGTPVKGSYIWFYWVDPHEFLYIYI